MPKLHHALAAGALLAAFTPTAAAQNRGLDWAHLFGGPDDEWVTFPNAIAVTRLDEAVVCGATRSSSFPVTAPRPPQGAEDAFVAWLTADGQTRFSTRFGGPSVDLPRAVQVDEARQWIYVAGSTKSATYPTTAGAAQTAHAGLDDMFLTIIDATNGNLVYSTLLGGSADEVAMEMVVDARGVVTLVGWSLSSDFPTTANAFSRTFSGGSQVGDAVVVTIDPSQAGAAGLRYASYFGGDGDEIAMHADVDGLGVVTFSGTATPWSSVPLPTTPDAFQRTYRGGVSDMFVARLDPSRGGATALLYCTYVGGNSGDGCNSADFAADGTVTIGGYSDSTDFPTRNAWQPVKRARTDGVVVRIDPRRSGLQALEYGTYVGGSGADVINGLVVDAAGVITMSAATTSSDLWTTPGAFQRGLGTNHDAWIGRLDPSRGELSYASYLGGSGSGLTAGLVAALDRTGGAFLAGYADTPGFPATIGSYAGRDDCFVARFNMLPQGAERCGVDSPTCSAGVYVGVSGMPTSGTKTFELRCAGMPGGNQAPLAGLLLADAAASCGPLTPVLGANLLVPPTIAVPLPPSSVTATVPIPLVGVAPGTTASFQFVWVNPPTCGAALLSASNLLRLVVQ